MKPLLFLCLLLPQALWAQDITWGDEALCRCPTPTPTPTPTLQGSLYFSMKRPKGDFNFLYYDKTVMTWFSMEHKKCPGGWALNNVDGQELLRICPPKEQK